MYKILKNFKKGDKIKVKILDINVDKERISLGIKHLNNDPVQDFLDKNPIKIKNYWKNNLKLMKKELKLNLDNNIFGYIKK